MTSATLPSAPTAARPVGPGAPSGAVRRPAGAPGRAAFEDLDDAITVGGQAAEFAPELQVQSAKGDRGRDGRDGHGGPDRSAEEGAEVPAAPLRVRGRDRLDGRLGARRSLGIGRPLRVDRSLRGLRGSGHLLRRGGRKDSSLQPGRWRDLLDRLEQGRHDRGELGDLGVGLRAGGEVCPN